MTSRISQKKKKKTVKEDSFTAVVGFYFIQKTFPYGCFLGNSTKFRGQFPLESMETVKSSCAELSKVQIKD